MAHPYSRTAALDLVETSLVLSGGLRATLILRPWDTTRPPVTAEITVHLTIPTANTGGATDVGLDGDARLADGAAEAELDGQTITAAQCRELFTQLHASRLFWPCTATTEASTPSPPPANYAGAHTDWA